MRLTGSGFPIFLGTTISSQKSIKRRLQEVFRRERKSACNDGKNMQNVKNCITHNCMAAFHLSSSPGSSIHKVQSEPNQPMHGSRPPVSAGASHHYFFLLKLCSRCDEKNLENKTKVKSQVKCLLKEVRFALVDR